MLEERRISIQYIPQKLHKQWKGRIFLRGITRFCASPPPPPPLFLRNKCERSHRSISTTYNKNYFSNIGCIFQLSLIEFWARSSGGCSSRVPYIACAQSKVYTMSLPLYIYWATKKSVNRVNKSLQQEWPWLEFDCPFHVSLIYFDLHRISYIFHLLWYGFSKHFLNLLTNN